MKFVTIFLYYFMNFIIVKTTSADVIKKTSDFKSKIINRKLIYKNYSVHPITLSNPKLIKPLYDVESSEKKNININRLKRKVNSKDTQNSSKQSIENFQSIYFNDLFKYDSLENNQNQNVTLYGLLNLNQLNSNNSVDSKPKYEITFRILPKINKIYGDFANRHKNQFIDDLNINDESLNSRIPKMLPNNNVTPQTLISNTSEVNFNVLNESVEYLIEKFKEAYPVEAWRQYGWFTDDYLYIINQHWLKYPPQSKEAHYILAFIYLFVLAAGMFGNLLVIFMFFKCRSLRTPANILVVNLAFSDLLMMTELPMLVYNSVFEGPALGQTACTVYGFIGGLTGTVSIGTLSAIAFDRYSVVVYPLDPLRAITGLRAKLSVVFTWMYGIFFSIIPALDIGLGKYVPEGFLTSCSYDYLSEEENAKIFIFAFFLAAWVLPLLLIIFCYAKIFHVVIMTRNLGKQAAGKMSSRHCKENEKRKTELKLAGVVMCVIGLFFAAWTPYAIVSLLGIFGYKHLLKPIYSMLPAMCAKLASCLDPFVYVVTHPKFRQECENLFMSKAQRNRKSTMRHGWSENPHNQSMKSYAKDLDITSENDIEVLEMAKVKTITIDNSTSDNSQSNKRGIRLSSVSPAFENIKTVSSHIIAKGIDANELPKSLDEKEDLKPPSWYVKPEFARSNSVKNVVKKIQRLTSSESIST